MSTRKQNLFLIKIINKMKKKRDENHRTKHITKLLKKKFSSKWAIDFYFVIGYKELAIFIIPLGKSLRLHKHIKTMSEQHKWHMYTFIYLKKNY